MSPLELETIFLFLPQDIFGRFTEGCPGLALLPFVRAFLFSELGLFLCRLLLSRF